MFEMLWQKEYTAVTFQIILVPYRSASPNLDFPDNVGNNLIISLLKNNALARVHNKDIGTFAYRLLKFCLNKKS